MNIWCVNLLRVIRNFKLRKPFWSEICILNCVNRLELKRELHLQNSRESLVDNTLKNVICSRRPFRHMRLSDCH